MITAIKNYGNNNLTSNNYGKNRAPHFGSICKGFEMNAETEMKITELAQSHLNYKKALYEKLPGFISGLMKTDGTKDELVYFITGVNKLGQNPPIVEGQLCRTRRNETVVSPNLIKIKSMVNSHESIALDGYTFDLSSLIESAIRLGEKLDKLS